MGKSPLKVSLSAQGLTNLQYRDDIDNFEFIVGEARYRYAWFIADFLSRRITELHVVVNAISAFEIKTKDAKGEFGIFISLG